MFVNSYLAISDEDIERKLNHMSPWLLRLEVNRARMLDATLSMYDITEPYGPPSQKTFMSYGVNNADRLVVRIRILNRGDSEDDGEDDVEEDVSLRQR